MRKLILFIGTILLAQDLYFSAFMDIEKAKRLLNSNPNRAQALFIEASSYLKQIVNSSIDKNQPSPQAMNLLGELYLNGWGVSKNRKKAVLLLCAAKNLGNFKAAKLVKEYNINCPTKINFKELKQ